MGFETALVEPHPDTEPGQPLTDESALDWAERLQVQVEQQLDLIIWEPDARRPLDVITGYAEAAVTWEMNAAAPLDITVPHDHRQAATFEQIRDTVVPIRAVHNGRNWDGLVTGVRLEGTGAERQYHIEAVSVYAYLAATMGRPQPGMPLWVQFPPQGFVAGPLPQVVNQYIAPNFDRLGIPYALAPYDVLADSESPWVALTTQETPLDELFEDALKWTGAELRIEHWHPGDPQPWPGADLTDPVLTIRTITRATRGGLQIGTGTLLDGLARSIAEQVASALAAALDGFAPDLAERIYEELTTYEVPALVWHEGMSAVEDSTIQWTHPTATTVIVGGKSPGWVNTLASGAVEAGIAMILEAAQVAIPGLGDLAANVLDNVFMAYEAHTDHVAAAALGTWGLREARKDGGAAAFTPDAAQAGAAGLYENAGSVSASIRTADGHPYHAWHDYDLGDPIAWTTQGQTFADRIRKITAIANADGIQVESTAGDDDPNAAPGTIIAERIKRLEKFVKAATLNIG